MKKIYLFISFIALSFLLVGCEGFGSGTKHNWGEWVTVKEATCVEKGLKVATCIDCGETKEANIHKVDHVYSEYLVKTEEGHYHECIMCSEHTVEKHTASSPNEHGKVKCVECDYVLEKGDETFYDNVYATFRNLYQFEMEQLSLEVVDDYDSTYDIVINDAVIAFDFADSTMVYIKGNAELAEGESDYILEESTYNVELLICGEEVYIKAIVDTPNSVEANMSGSHYIKVNLNEMNIMEEMGLYIDLDQIKSIVCNEEVNAALDVIVEKVYAKFGFTKGDMVELLINKCFNETTTDNTTEFIFTFDFIMEIIDSIKGKTVEQLYDDAFGKGKFEQLASRVDQILNIKLGVLVDRIENVLGIEFEDLTNLVKALENTMPDLGSEYAEIYDEIYDIIDELQTGEFRNKTLKELLFGKVDQDIVEDNIEEFKEMLENTKDVVLLELTEDNYNAIKNIVDYLNEAVSIKLITDNTGVVEKITIDVDFTTDEIETPIDVDLKLDLHCELSKVAYKFDTQQIIDEVNAGIKLMDFENATLENGTFEKTKDQYLLEYSEEQEIVIAGVEYLDVYTYEVTVDMTKASGYYVISSCGNEIVYSIYVPVEVYRTNKRIIKETNGVYLETSSSYEEEYIYFIYDTETKKFTVTYDYDGREHDFVKIKEVTSEDGVYKEIHYECSKCHDIVIKKYAYYGSIVPVEE